MDRFSVGCSSQIDKEKTLIFDNVRVSVITDRILRVERSMDGVFEDRPTQVVFERNFAKTHFNYKKNGNKNITYFNKTVKIFKENIAIFHKKRAALTF